MKPFPLCATAASMLLLLNACATSGGKTIGSLQRVNIKIEESAIDGSLEKALASYQVYLQETPETAFTPEAMRRIADLKIKQAHRAEEGEPRIDATTGSGVVANIDARSRNRSAGLSAPVVGAAAEPGADSARSAAGGIGLYEESEREFEERVAAGEAIASAPRSYSVGESEELLAANAREAIELYRDLLRKYPMYERNDQVMYQLSRAYEETGEIELAVEVLRQLVGSFPASRHLDEAYFRLGEYYFTRKRYLDAEESYGRVVNIGAGSGYYELALYKRGWSLFKQEMYEEALDDYVRMLDYKVAGGYDFEQQSNEVQRKHVEDTFRVVSYSFSYLGGAESVVDYFERKGGREYEYQVYSHLGEYYLEKRRYQDAAMAYNAFVERNSLHRIAPDFSIRVIEIYQRGGFPQLVLDAKKDFATTYGLAAEYWTLFDIEEYAGVVEFLQSNLIDLASHYHSSYQDPRLEERRADSYRESIHWYRAYLHDFSEQPKAPEIHYQMAGLMLENRDFHHAAVEYERTAYEYPAHDNAGEAGYAAVFAWREYLANSFADARAAQREPVLREIIRSSLKFAERYPQHPHAPQILLGAVEELYALNDHAPAISNGRLLLEKFPTAESEIRRSAWILVAHASFDTLAYEDAEVAYAQALALTAEQAEDRPGLVDNLAASIYQQGDRARTEEDHKLAAEHFLRIRQAAPGASLLATAEYDAAASLITLEDWSRAASVLNSFRRQFPDHELASEATIKLAVVYQESGELLLAAGEFERIERESQDSEIRREALTQAADLYSGAGENARALTALRRYVELFPNPMEPALETRQKIADLYRESGDQQSHIAELKEIVRIEARAGRDRSDRTRYLAGSAALVLAEPSFHAYTEVRLVSPLEQNLNTKRSRMRNAVDTYTNLLDYQVADVTAAATFYLAEIYFHFSRALQESERPTDLSPLELEEYELALEDQVYPFEERAIRVHEQNVALLGIGVYNRWISQSIGKLASLVPARYAREEVAGQHLQTIVPVAPQAGEPKDS